MGDVGERPAVDECGRAFERLHEIGLQGVFQKRRHGARRLEIARRHGSALIGIAHDDARKPRFQVGQRRGKAQNGHHFACDGDIEPILAWDAVLAAAEAVFDVAKLAVVHIHAAAENDLFGIDIERVALEDMVIQHGAQKVVRRADGMEIAREVQVDVLHRDDLGIAAARRAALDAEHGPQGRLAQRHDDVFIQALHAVRQPDGGRRLAFARRRGRDGGDEDELAVLLLPLHHRKIDLRLILAVIFDVVFLQPRARRDLGNML